MDSSAAPPSHRAYPAHKAPKHPADKAAPGAAADAADAGAIGAIGAKPTRRLGSVELFGPHQEIEIEHGSAIYRLRQTALGKLILTK